MAVSEVAPAIVRATERLIPFGPWSGCVTVREKIALEPHQLGPDSTEWWVSPEDGRLVRRGGSTIQLDTLSSGAEVTGALESKWGARAQQFIPLHLPSVSDGYESPGWLVTDESGKEGTLAWVDRDTNAFHQLGKNEFNQTSSGHYRQDGSAGEVRSKVIPCISESAGIDYHRLHSATMRKFPFAGSRKLMEREGGIYSPGAQSCPYWWNKRRNTSATSGTEKMRARPWGLDPAYWAPATTVPGAAGGVASANWTGGNRFYEAWAFRYADGSTGPPFRISTTQTTPARGGLVTVGTSPNFYLYRTISGIPLGPQDGPAGPCVARIGYRSLQATATEPLPDFSKMYVFAIIEDNVSTSMVDYNGSDDGLTTPAENLYNQTWPPRAQWAIPVEGRTLLGGKIRQNPYALIIGPCGAGASRDLNVADTDTTSLYGTVFYHVKITNTGTAATSSLVVKRTSGGVTTAVTFAFNTYATLQALSDAINETLFSDTADEWFCQICPLVDGNISTLNLRATSATGDEDDATVNTAPADGTTLNVRAYCPTYFFAAAFTETYLATLPTDNTGIWLSDGDAGSGNGCYSLFRVRLGDRKFPSGHAVGRFMGAAPCTATGGVVAIVYYERARFALRNIKGGGSLANADYQLVPLDLLNGCIAHRTIIEGAGFSGCLGQDGYWVSEAVPGAAIYPFRDHYDQFPAPGQLAGDIAYAIRTDAALAAAGSDTYSCAMLIGDKLRLRYRTAIVGGAYQDSGLDYWFGKGQDAAGLASMLRRTPDGQTLYGTSCPVRSQKYGVAGAITDSTGRRIYAWQDTNAGGTGDGRVDEIDMALAPNDNGTAITSNAYSAAIISGAYAEMEIKSADPMWRKNGSGLTAKIYGDVDRATVLYTLTLATSGSSVMKRNRFEFGMAARGMHQCCEVWIADDGTATGACEVRAFPVLVKDKLAETRYA